MYPVLIVEGVARKLVSIDFDENSDIYRVGYFDENNSYQSVFDENVKGIDGSAKTDLNKSVQWHGRYDPINEAVSNMIDENNTDLQNLAIQYIENDKPFAPNEYQSKYTQLKQRNFGLMDVQELIFEAMQEDVDLSGGSDG